MSNHLDLTEALRVGTERLRLAGHEPADQLAGAVLLGAAPVIERQVRERIAAEQAALKVGDEANNDYDKGSRSGWNTAVEACLWIARGRKTVIARGGAA